MENLGGAVVQNCLKIIENKNMGLKIWKIGILCMGIL